MIKSTVKIKFIATLAVLFFALVCLTGPAYSPAEADAAAKDRTVITKTVGKLSERGLSEIVLSGEKEKDGAYYKNVKITVRDLRTKKARVVITPEENGGYSPAITIADFTGDGVKEIFYNADSGGSGAFAYSYVYRISEEGYESIFDFNKVKNDYTAKYADGYKVRVENAGSGATYSIDISWRGEEYLGGIYNENGTLKNPLDAEVSAVNTVLPYFMPDQNKYGLLIMRRITGLYSADSFGYTQDFTEFTESGFTTYFSGILITD